MANINLSGYSNWVPIGNVANSFCGNYDGNGYSISDISINRPTEDGIGFFGQKSDGLLENITIIDPDIVGRYSVGGVTGSSYSYAVNVVNCKVTGGSISGVYSVGGIVGYVSDAGIAQCGAKGTTVKGNGSYVGGVVGQKYGGITDRCYFYGTIIQQSDGRCPCGGILGGQAYANIINCICIASIRGSESGEGYYTNGISPGGTYASVDNCLFVGTLSGGRISPVFGRIDIVGGCSGSYWDKDVSGILTATYGTPKSSSELQSESTFEGWDFDTVWEMSGSYPTLQPISPPRALQTGKNYVLVEECESTDVDATMEYDGKWYKYINTLAAFEKITHEAAGESATYTYGGNAVIYGGQYYEYLASGITDPEGLGGYGEYLPDTTRTVESLSDREVYVNFYYVIPPLAQVKRPVWAKKVITWKDVANAEAYTVRLYNASNELLDTQTVIKGAQRYDYTDLIENYLPAGSYTATVQAMPEVT